jgi:hypothetical protein
VLLRIPKLGFQAPISKLFKASRNPGLQTGKSHRLALSLDGAVRIGPQMPLVSGNKAPQMAGLDGPAARRLRSSEPGGKLVSGSQSGTYSNADWLQRPVRPKSQDGFSEPGWRRLGLIVCSYPEPVRMMKCQDVCNRRQRVSVGSSSGVREAGLLQSRGEGAETLKVGENGKHAGCVQDKNRDTASLVCWGGGGD